MWHIFNTDILHMYLTPNTYCVTSGLPACRTDLPVSVRVLEGLDQSQRLVHGAPDREIIHGDLAQRSFRINDKQTPEKKSNKDPIMSDLKLDKKMSVIISIFTANVLAFNTLLTVYFSELVNCSGIQFAGASIIINTISLIMPF